MYVFVVVVAAAIVVVVVVVVVGFVFFSRIKSQISDAYLDQLHLDFVTIRSDQNLEARSKPTSVYISACNIPVLFTYYALVYAALSKIAC